MIQMSHNENTNISGLNKFINDLIQYLQYC